MLAGCSSDGLCQATPLMLQYMLHRGLPPGFASVTVQLLHVLLVARSHSSFQRSCVCSETGNAVCASVDGRVRHSNYAVALI